MNAEQFIEENYFGLKIDCPRDIQTIYQALEDYYKEQLRLYSVSQRSELLIDFLLHLNNKGLINNHDFDYQKEAKKYAKKLINCG